MDGGRGYKLPALPASKFSHVHVKITDLLAVFIPSTVGAQVFTAASPRRPSQFAIISGAPSQPKELQMFFDDHVL